jgi:hypothetical protein
LVVRSNFGFLIIRHHQTKMLSTLSLSPLPSNNNNSSTTTTTTTTDGDIVQPNKRQRHNEAQTRYVEKRKNTLKMLEAEVRMLQNKLTGHEVMENYVPPPTVEVLNIKGRKRKNATRVQKRAFDKNMIEWLEAEKLRLTQMLGRTEMYEFLLNPVVSEQHTPR